MVTENLSKLTREDASSSDAYSSLYTMTTTIQYTEQQTQTL